MLPVIILSIENDDDREFMTGLYYQYNRLIYSEAKKILGCDSDAEDVLQDVLEKLIDKLDVLRGLESKKLINYIAECARNRARNVLKARARGPVSLEDQEWSADDDRVENEVLRSVSAAELRSVLDRLKERSAALLRMTYILQFSNEEIARELNIKRDSVRGLLSRARREAFALLKDSEM